jgi:hypothetical protein
MRGRFSCGCPHPHGKVIKPGTVITLIFVADTMFRTGFGLSDRYPRLSTAGTPVRLGTSLAPRKRH